MTGIRPATWKTTVNGRPAELRATIDGVRAASPRQNVRRSTTRWAAPRPANSNSSSRSGRCANPAALAQDDAVFPGAA